MPRNKGVRRHHNNLPSGIGPWRARAQAPHEPGYGTGRTKLVSRGPFRSGFPDVSGGCGDRRLDEVGEAYQRNDGEYQGQEPVAFEDALAYQASNHDVADDVDR